MTEATNAPWLQYHEQPIQLHSGGWSHWLVDADAIFADDNLRELVLATWETEVYCWRPPVDVISVPTGGDAWAEALRERLGDWTRMWILHSKCYRVVVDDVVTTGASIFGDGRAHLRLAVVDRRERINPRDKPVAAWAHIPLPLCEAPREEPRP